MGTASSPLAGLEAYQKQCPNGWSSGSDDGYFCQNLARRLLASGRSDELHWLLIATPDWGQASKQAARVIRTTLLTAPIPGKDHLPRSLQRYLAAHPENATSVDNKSG